MIYIVVLVLLAIMGIGAWVLVVRKQTKDIVKADPTSSSANTPAVPTNMPLGAPPVDQPVQPAPTEEVSPPNNPSVPPNQV